MNSNIKWIAGIVGAGIVAALFIVWFVLLSGPSAAPAQNTAPSFGTGSTQTTTGVTPTTDATNSGTPVGQQIAYGAGKIFKVTDGPVAGATLLITTRPTTTVARFVLATNGHIMDVALDTPGAVARAVSNTTIPGIINALWSEGGRGALLQYLDSGNLKTAHFTLPAPAATSSTSVRVQFLPVGATNVTVSPDGTSIAYLIKTAAGADGYTAKANGTSSKKLFSLPFSQLLLSWPAQNTLLAQTASAAGVPGAVFSVDTKSGGVAPLLYAQGLTATANIAFSRLIYQTSDGTSLRSYIRDTKSGLSAPTPAINPSPEQCVWSKFAGNVVFCAVPIQAAPANYLDLWHQGVTSAAENIFAINTDINGQYVAAAPGGEDGGEESSIAEMALSPDDRYLLFIRKGDRSLWAVRLSN